jgi:hypothetical protein
MKTSLCSERRSREYPRVSFSATRAKGARGESPPGHMNIMLHNFRIALGLALAATAGCDAALSQEPANRGYPTVDRVEFVLECMRRNGGKQEYLYKCACLIDRIAEKLSYDDYVEGSTVSRNQNLGGERAGLFRDPPRMREVAKRYQEVHGAAMKQCQVER